MMKSTGSPEQVWEWHGRLARVFVFNERSAELRFGVFISSIIPTAPNQNSALPLTHGRDALATPRAFFFFHFAFAR
jgi:hypothetical protein